MLLTSCLDWCPSWAGAVQHVLSSLTPNLNMCVCVCVCVYVSARVARLVCESECLNRQAWPRQHAHLLMIESSS